MRAGNGAINVTAVSNATVNCSHIADQSTPRAVVDIVDGAAKLHSVDTSEIPQVAFGTPTELTIAAGVITVTGSYHKVDTESDAATDDLVTITAPADDGHLLILTTPNNARDVTLKDGTGNLALAGDFTLSVAADRITLIWDDNLSLWCEIARSTNL